MSEIISPYVFPILKHSSVNKKRHPFIKQRYTTLSKNDLVEEVCLEFKVDKNEFEPLFETDVDYREKCERVLRKLDINY